MTDISAVEHVESASVRSDPPSATTLDPVSDRAFRLGTVVVFALAFVLGLLRLSHNDIWFDEAASLFFARQPGINFFRVLMREDTHGPVYYGLLKLWILAFGESAWAARLPSVLCAASAVFVVAHLGARIYGRTFGLPASLLVALSPFHLYYAQEVRFHAFIELLVSLHVLCFVCLAVQNPTDSVKASRWSWWGFIATGVAFVLTFYLSGLLLVAESFCVFLLWKRIARRRVLAAFAVTAAICSLWLPALIWQVRHTHGSVGWIRDQPTLRFLAHAGQIFTAGRTATWLDHVVTLTLALAVGIGLVRGFRSRDRGQLAIACCFAIPLLAILGISVWRPLYEARYLFMILPLFFLLAAAGLWHSRISWLRVVVLVPILASVAIADIRQYGQYKFKERWNDAASYLRKAALPTDDVVVLPSHEIVTLTYYFPDFKRLRGTNWASDVNHLLVRGRRLWLFDYREDYRLLPGQLTSDAIQVDSHTFGKLNVSCFLLRR